MAKFLVRVKPLVDCVAFIGNPVSLQEHNDVILEDLVKNMILSLKVSLNHYRLKKLKLYLLCISFVVVVAPDIGVVAVEWRPLCQYLMSSVLTWTYCFFLLSLV